MPLTHKHRERKGTSNEQPALSSWSKCPEAEKQTPGARAVTGTPQGPLKGLRPPTAQKTLQGPCARQFFTPAFQSCTLHAVYDTELGRTLDLCFPTPALGPKAALLRCNNV